MNISSAAVYVCLFFSICTFDLYACPTKVDISITCVLLTRAIDYINKLLCMHNIANLFRCIKHLINNTWICNWNTTKCAYVRLRLLCFYTHSENCESKWHWSEYRSDRINALEYKMCFEKTAKTRWWAKVKWGFEFPSLPLSLHVVLSSLFHSIPEGFGHF